MDIETARRLCKINDKFYHDNHASFSATRTSAWDGWQRCLDAMPDIIADASRTISILDCACGNLRFEVFLTETFPEHKFDLFAIDNCRELLEQSPPVQYQQLDIIAALQERHPSELIGAPPCNLCVSFGFMHHIPLQSLRRQFLLCLFEKTRPGGYLVVSFWQFMNNDALARKAQITHEKASRELGLPQLDEGDFLLGWKNSSGAYRYCHNFTDTEIDELVASLAERVETVCRFSCDGRSRNLNSYIVLKVR